MFIFALIILSSLAAGVAYFMLAQAVLWQAALLALGVLALWFAVFIAALFIAGRFADTKKPLEKQNPFIRGAAYYVCMLLCTLAGIKPEIRGLEKLPEEQRFLMVCNHRSMFDPLMMLYTLKEYNLAFISKPSNMALPVVGRAMYSFGCLGIDRENDRNALKTILQAADYLKRGMCSMVIYPEGTRSKSCELLPFHAGSFKAAQRAGVGVAVASIRGTEAVSRNFLRRRTEVCLNILEFIPADMVKNTATAELSQYSRGLIAGDLNA